MSPSSDAANEAPASALAADLRMAISAVNRRLRDQAHSADLTGSQKSVIARLERDGPATVTSLALAEGIRPQSMGATVASLEAMGLIGGHSDPADGRRTILDLTDQCREMLREGRAARQDWLLQALQARLTGAERDRMADMVVLLNRLIES